MTRGVVGPFVAGHQFLLVEQRLAEFLQQLDIESVTFRTAVIVDPKSGNESRTHTRVIVQQFFRAADIRDLALDGYRLLTMGDEYYFVSPALKGELEAAGFDCLQFSEGLSSFAG
jgi:hypothetical protein